MIHRTNFIVCLVLILCASAAGSRCFDGSQCLQYDAASPGIWPGLREFGISVWTRIPSANGSLEIVHNLDAQGNGFRLYYTPGQINFTYTGPAEGGGTTSMSVSAAYPSMPSPEPLRWVHIAADISLPKEATGTIRLAVDSPPSMTQSTGRTFDGMLATDAVIVAGDASTPPDGSLTGDVHDLCFINGLWQPAEIANLATQSAWDVASNILFNARLRRTLDDPHNPGVFESITVVGEDAPTRGMGPAITYADQLPTVLVIGDTQNLPNRAAAQALAQFLEDYSDSLRFAAIFHVGDWTNSGVNPDHLDKARDLANGMVAAGVPWACTLGNHDYPPDSHESGTPESRETTVWRQLEYMPYQLFQYVEGTTPYDWFVGKMSDTEWSQDPPLDEYYAHAFTFDVSGVEQLGISLPYAPTSEMLLWCLETAAAWNASHVGPANAHYVWVVNHEFISRQPYLGTQWNYDGCISHLPTGPMGAWAHCLRFIPNLAFVFCGHLDTPACHRCEPNCSGDPTFMLLVDDQGWWGDPPHGGNGFMQILSVDLTNDEVSVESYAPLVDTYYTELEASGPEDLQFVLDLTETCEITDCNENGLDDVYDCRLGLSQDCNGNGIPDECEVPALGCCGIINEIRISPAHDKYAEIYGAAGLSLDDHYYIVLGDDVDSQPSSSGVIEAIVDLTGYTIPQDQIFLIAEDELSGGIVPDLTATLNFETNDNVTHLLVEGYPGPLGTDLDTDDDGALDSDEFTIVSSVALMPKSLGESEHVYSPVFIECDDTEPCEIPHVVRCWDGVQLGEWSIAEEDDSPGLQNPTCYGGCTADVNEDGIVDVLDLLAVVAAWGNPGGPEDCNGDGVVNVLDLLMVIAEWGDECE